MKVMVLKKCRVGEGVF